MKRSIIAGYLALAALAAAPSAQAADLGLAPLYKAPPPVSAAYNWSGFYLGANGGGAWGDSRWQGTGNGKVDLSGGMAGGTAGFNWQTGPVVLGVEGDIDWAGLSGSTATATCPGGSCGTSETWLSTVRGRAGYAFDRFLPYVTGGLAVGDIRAATPGLPGGSATNTGWTAGGGIEFALPGNWSAKAEYLHVDLGSFNCGTGCGGTPNENVALRENVFRAGVNYHFGWGK